MLICLICKEYLLVPALKKQLSMAIFSQEGRSVLRVQAKATSQSTVKQDKQILNWNKLN
jgi:hypothetical protein